MKAILASSKLGMFTLGLIATSCHSTAYSQNKGNVYKTNIEHAENVNIKKILPAERVFSTITPYYRNDSAVVVDTLLFNKFSIQVNLVNAGNTHAQDVELDLRFIVKRDKYLDYTSPRFGKANSKIASFPADNLCFIKCIMNYPINYIAQDTLYIFITGSYKDYKNTTQPVEISLLHLPYMDKGWFSPLGINVDSVLKVATVPEYFGDR